MKPALIDTDLLSMYFHGNEVVKTNFDKYRKKYSSINISIITYYEIISGLKHKDAKKQLESFLQFSNQNTVLPLTQQAANISAELYASLRKIGKPVDDIDLLIAGIALSHGLMLVTNNEKHFGKIKKLEIVNWSKK